MAVDEVRITLPLPAALMREVDEARRGQPRTAWIRDAMEARLRDGKPQPPTLMDALALDEPEAALAEAITERDTEHESRQRHPSAGTGGAVHVGVKGHLHKAEAYGTPYLNAGGKWTLRRCVECNEDLPPRRV